MTKKEPSKVVTFWLNEIKASRKREEKFRKIGQEVLTIYEADPETDEKGEPFNILHSNTATLRPALFSAKPRPVVQRRFKDDDPLGKAASDAARRMLEYHFDTNKEDYETLTDAMSSAVLDSLLPGRGGIQLKYDADFTPIDEPRPPDEHDDDPVDEKSTGYYVSKEQVCYESIIWDRFYVGYAKRWTKVPWIAYQFHLTKEEVASLLGKKIATKLTYQSVQDADDDGESKKRNRDKDDDVGQRRTALIYQIWDKAGGRKVRYISPNYKEDELRVDDDPLELTGFFNTPRPLQFIEKSSSLVPTAPYQVYRSQAQELNRLTRRIKKITEAIKARGLYMGEAGADIEKLMDKDDNALVPMEANVVGAEKGIQGIIWMVPLDVLIQVLQQLYQAREACKQTIYEITGIADIMRGATNASETLGAQQIKNQWGTLRLKWQQGEVGRYVVDVERMTLEIAASKFDEETWAAMTGLPFVTTKQRAMLDKQMAMMQQQMAGVPPESLPPQIQQQQAQLQAELQKPVWGQVLQLLKDDLQRSYRIDIESNSTVQPEAAEDMEAMQEMMQILGQFLQAVGPLVLNGSMPFEAAQNVMLGVARKTRFGPEIEDALKAMQPPKPPDDGKGKEVEMQQKMMDLEKQHAVKEIDFKKKESEMALKEQAMQVEHEDKKRKMDLDLQEMGLQLKEHQFNQQQQVERGMFNMEKERASEQIDTSRKMHQIETGKQTMGSLVNQKVKDTIAPMTKTIQTLIQQMSQAMMEQSQEQAALLQSIAEAAARPRQRKAIRDQAGNIQAVEETPV